MEFSTFCYSKGKQWLYLAFSFQFIQKFLAVQRIQFGFCRDCSLCSIGIRFLFQILYDIIYGFINGNVRIVVNTAIQFLPIHIINGIIIPLIHRLNRNKSILNTKSQLLLHVFLCSYQPFG